MDELGQIKNLINSINQIIEVDYDKYYNELLKNAIKYGMSINDFWHSNIENYYAYEIAYIEKLHEKAHLEGYYNYLALGVVVSNIFRKEGQKSENYPLQNLYEESNKEEEEYSPEPSLSKQDRLEEEFRNRMMCFY